MVHHIDFSLIEIIMMIGVGVFVLCLVLIIIICYKQFQGKNLRNKRESAKSIIDLQKMGVLPPGITVVNSGSDSPSTDRHI